MSVAQIRQRESDNQWVCKRAGSVDNQNLLLATYFFLLFTLIQTGYCTGTELSVCTPHVSTEGMKWNANLWLFFSLPNPEPQLPCLTDAGTEAGAWSKGAQHPSLPPPRCVYAPGFHSAQQRGPPAVTSLWTCGFRWVKLKERRSHSRPVSDLMGKLFFFSFFLSFTPFHWSA